MGINAYTTRFAVCVILASGSAISADEISANPRYRLTTGREFSYHNEARSERGGGDSVYIVEWKVWAIDRGPDGAWKLIIRCDLKEKQDAPAGSRPAQDDVDTLVWRCRMFEDGRLVGASTRGTVRDPFRLFPRLPAGLDERERGWESAGPEAEGVTLHHRLTPGTDDGGETLSITTRSEGPEDKVYVLSHEYRATFDAHRGCVTRVETEDSSGYAHKGVTRGTIELVAVEDRGEAWAAAFGREADRYFDAAEAYEAASKRAVRDAARCKELLAEARAKLEEARAGLTAPVFLDAIGQRLAGHDGAAKHYAERAGNRAARLGKPAGEWEAKDIEGKTHRLADYRGKVVVMDFWYRGCGWCIHAMPQINRLADTFRDEPVAVLGMTIDEDEKDARVVVEAMGLKYPAIKAAGIPEKYGVRGYPTLVVIDKAGKVREIHVGYSPHLYEDLSGLIRGLLAEAPAE